MNNRKQRVIKIAHQLFIEKGFQATSIQDILDYSGISKGTFYNYFSSKSELLIALFKSIYKQLDKDTNEMLIGQDASDIGILIKQIELHLKTSRANKLLFLFEEVMVSNDPDLKEYLKQNHLRNVSWIYSRFVDIFGEEKKPYLLDCSIMFIGMLQQHLKFNAMVNGSLLSNHEIVRYCVARIVNIVEEVSIANDKLLDPTLLTHWLPKRMKRSTAFRENLHSSVIELKKILHHSNEQEKYFGLLDFIEEELLQSKSPRGFLIESALNSLKGGLTEIRDFEILKAIEQLAADILSNPSDREE